MRALEFIAGHVTFKLCYNKIYQLKTTLMKLTGIKIFQIYLLIKKNAMLMFPSLFLLFHVCIVVVCLIDLLFRPLLLSGLLGKVNMF